jgi:hypothetical protein
VLPSSCGSHVYLPNLLFAPSTSRSPFTTVLVFLLSKGVGENASVNVKTAMTLTIMSANILLRNVSVMLCMYNIFRDINLF